MNTTKALLQLETSVIWKKTAALATHARAFAETLPRVENYHMSDPIVRAGITLTSDIAMAVGKSNDDVDFDYRYARGHLFTLKGLVLMAQEYGFGQKAEALLTEIDAIEKLLNIRIAELEAAAEAKTKAITAAGKK